MPLRIEPLPRMAGHLPFMRGRRAAWDDIGPGMVAAFGAPLAGESRTDLAPLALRETSAYFGSHFSANMKSAMDVDRRRRLRSAAVAGSMADLGDLEPDPATGSFDDAIRAAVARIRRAGAIPLLLGGDDRCLAPALRGLREGGRADEPVAALLIQSGPPARPVEADAVAILSSESTGALDGRVTQFTFEELRLRPEAVAADVRGRLGGSAVHVGLDASAIAAHWHGANSRAGFEGLSLSECRSLLGRIDAANVASLSITGLDPTIAGLSTVKTGQRLLLTAVLDLIYARLGVLAPRGGDAHG